MKKFFVILTAALVMMSCGKESLTSGKNESDTPMDKSEQQDKFKSVAENVLNQVNVTEIQDVINQAMSFEEIDPSEKYSESIIAQDVMDKINAMTKLRGNVFETVYNLYALRGSYSFIDGEENQESSDNSINVNYENKYLVNVVFSEETNKVLLYEGSEEKTYVEVPEQIGVEVYCDGNLLVKAGLNLKTNISDVTVAPNMEDVSVSVSMRVEVAGYSISVDKLIFNNNCAEINTSVYHGDKMLFTETLSVEDIEFESVEPYGAGKGYFELNILGEMQVKVTAKNVTAFIDAVERLDKYSNDEVKVKAIVAEMNELVDGGVYFSSDFKQSGVAFYPFYQERYYYGTQSYWTANPLYVLSYGTIFEDFTDFFSETYFRSVINKAEHIADEISAAFD